MLSTKRQLLNYDFYELLINNTITEEHFLLLSCLATAIRTNATTPYIEGISAALSAAKVNFIYSYAVSIDGNMKGLRKLHRFAEREYWENI